MSACNLHLPLLSRESITNPSKAPWDRDRTSQSRAIRESKRKRKGSAFSSLGDFSEEIG